MLGAVPSTELVTVIYSVILLSNGRPAQRMDEGKKWLIEYRQTNFCLRLADKWWEVMSYLEPHQKVNDLMQFQQLSEI